MAELAEDHHAAGREVQQGAELLAGIQVADPDPGGNGLAGVLAFLFH